MSHGSPRFRLRGRLLARRTVARGLQRIEIELPRPLPFLPGQFAMLNFAGPGRLTFGRPLSILAAEGNAVSFLYRVVGRGTGLLDAAPVGEPIDLLGPLGSSFPPPPADGRVVLLAGGCGLPPLWDWWRRHGRERDRAWFGAREAPEAPWEMLGGWQVALESLAGLPPGREAALGRVVDACAADAALAGGQAGLPAVLMACGPRPMLAAAVRLARERGWGCLVSVEEQMGCGYGVCRGCVVPAAGGGNLAACADGPVLPADGIDWETFAGPAGGGTGMGQAAAPACGAPDGPDGAGRR